MQFSGRKTSLALAISLASAGALAAESDRLEEIIVTGQKLERSIFDTKESVAVLTGADLIDRNLTELTDVIGQTPGVTGNQFGFRIRGVRSSDGASQPNRGDLASVVIDGVTVSGWVKSEGVSQLWDVGQVEVLRGPQSTNLGRNALAGAIVINTNNPEYDNTGSVRLGVGNYGQREAKAMANFNVSDGVSALRLSYENSRSDGAIDNITRNEDDFGGYENQAFRLKWLFEPSEDVKAVFSYQRIENEYGASRILLGQHRAEDRINPSDTKDIFETKADLISLNVDYQLNEILSLKSITAYQDGERFRQSDADLTANGFGNGGGVVVRNSEDKSWSQELRLTYSDEKLRGSTGAYYTSIEAKRQSDTQSDINLITEFNAYAASQGFPVPLGNVLTNPINLAQFFGPGAPTLPALYPQYFGRIQEGFTNVDTTSWALFTEWEADLSEQWTLSLGVRYDQERQDYDTASTGSSRGTLPSPLAAPFGTTAIPGLGINLNTIINLANVQLSSFTQDVPRAQSSEDFSNILPHAGISYHWNDEVTTSFFIKKSYRSGGSELTLLNGVNHFDEEELISYEFSLRAVVLEGDGLFNMNVYYSDWEDQQVAVQEPGTSSSAFTMTVNAGESTLAGVEMSFDYQLSDTVSLFAGGALNKTEYEKFLSADGTDYSGNEFTFAPEYSAVAGINYRSGNGWFANANVNYASKSYSDVGNKKQLDGRTLVNLTAGYELEQWRLEAFAKNLFDKTYLTHNDITAGDGSAAAIAGAPRMVGIRATYSL